MRSYNGFDSNQRARAQKYINQQIALGNLLRPSHCEACGMTDGIFDYHAEDYSEPFGPHVYEYSLCYLCHMVLHCRFSSPDGWKKYRDLVTAGWRWAPATSRSFHGLVVKVLDGHIGPLFRVDPQPNCMFHVIAE